MLQFMLIVIFTQIIVGLVNWIYDPLSIHSDTGPGFKNHERLAKAAAVDRIKPHTIILGSSIGRRGLKSTNPVFRILPVYNLSMGSATPYEMFRYLQHSIAVSDIKQTIILVDYHLFLDSNSKDTGFNEGYLAVSRNNDATFLYPLKILWDGLFSLSALMNINNINNKIITDKFGNKNNYIKNKKFKSLKQMIKAFMAPGPESGRANLIDSKTGESSVLLFGNVLDLAYKNDIDVKIVMSPYHQYFWRLYTPGMYEKLYGFKRQIVKINNIAAKKTHKKPYPVWDFNYCNHVTMSLPSDYKDNLHDFPYFDVIHYKPVLGDIILNTIFENVKEEPGFSGFGMKLNIDTDIKLNRQMQLYNQYCFPYLKKYILN